MATGAQLKLAGEACATCPARNGRCVPPELSPSGAQLAVVGEAPGRNEVEQGRPFIGASGRMLMRGLSTLRLRRDDVHWTNAVLCECGERELPKARQACAQRLRTELAASGAPVVMPVGAMGLHSALALTKKPSILAWRGSVSRVTFAPAPVAASMSSRAPASTGAWVLPTIHPAFVMRAPKWGPVLEIDVQRVGRVMAEGFKAPEDSPRRRLVIARTRESLREALASLQGDEASFDVETVGLGPHYTKLVCYGLSDGQLTVVVPWSKASNGNEPFWIDGGAEAVRLTNAALRGRAAVTHNGPAFDHVVAARYGIRIERWEDTLLGTHALAAHMPKGLAHVVTLHLDVPPWKQQEDRGADIDRLWVYNGRDCLYTALARAEQRRELAAA